MIWKNGRILNFFQKKNPAPKYYLYLDLHSYLSTKFFSNGDWWTVMIKLGHPPKITFSSCRNATLSGALISILKIVSFSLFSTQIFIDSGLYFRSLSHGGDSANIFDNIVPKVISSENDSIKSVVWCSGYTNVTGQWSIPSRRAT